jgi:hypothetical protein
MAWNPGAGWAAPIQQGNAAGGEQDATPSTTAQGTSGLERLAQRTQRRRARTDRGTFQGDNPATTDVDEAYEAEPSADREN